MDEKSKTKKEERSPVDQKPEKFKTNVVGFIFKSNSDVVIVRKKKDESKEEAKTRVMEKHHGEFFSLEEVMERKKTFPAKVGKIAFAQ